MAGLPHAMRLQPAEAARVGEEFLDGERLAAHHQHDAVEPGAVERVPVGCPTASAHVDIGGDGADAGSGLSIFIGQAYALRRAGKDRPHGPALRTRKNGRNDAPHRGFVFRGSARRPAGGGAGHLSQPSHHPDHALCAGRRQRFPGAHAGRGAADAAQRDGGGSECRRRRRRGRLDAGGQGQARRLHPAAQPHRPVDHPGALQEARTSIRSPPTSSSACSPRRR